MLSLLDSAAAAQLCCSTVLMFCYHSTSLSHFLIGQLLSLVISLYQVTQFPLISHGPCTALVQYITPPLLYLAPQLVLCNLAWFLVSKVHLETLSFEAFPCTEWLSYDIVTFREILPRILNSTQTILGRRLLTATPCMSEITSKTLLVYQQLPATRLKHNTSWPSRILPQKLDLRISLLLPPIYPWV